MSLEVKQPWYSKLESGDKLYEGRLWTPSKKQLIKNYLGKPIVIINDDDHNQSFDAVLDGYLLYPSFSQALNNHLPQLLPPIQSVEEGITVYREFFSEESEKEYGVV
jgi:ASC-1-like (ASCH) protein